MSEQKLIVKIEFGEHKAEFSGDFDTVTRQVMNFLFDLCPALSILSKIKLEVDFEQLINDLHGIIKIAKEGILLLAPKERLTGPDLICLYLVGTYVGHKLGIFEKDSMTVDELSQYTGIKKNVVSVRLTELARSRIVSADTGERRITSIGIEHFKSEILPKIRV